MLISGVSHDAVYVDLVNIVSGTYQFHVKMKYSWLLLWSKTKWKQYWVKIVLISFTLGPYCQSRALIIIFQERHRWHKPSPWTICKSVVCKDDGVDWGQDQWQFSGVFDKTHFSECGKAV